MKCHFLAASIMALACPLFALDGQVRIHDPSTIAMCEGKYYTFGTGGSSLVSDDGWTWQAGPRASRTSMGPDMVFSNGRYYVYCATNVGGQPRAEIALISTKTLNADSPDFGWVEEGIVGGSDGVEDCNAIDPGIFVDPTDGKMWMTYGSYFGYIRLVELNPNTGKRIDPDAKPIDLAINMEASIIIHHEGWYYLLGTRGSCCSGANSGYHIRVGRARKVSGPFLDHEGLDLIKGGGKLFCASAGRVIGPGHFGLLDLGDGVQKFSCHYEADLDRNGISVLDIRPLLWKDGWPIAGENMKEGTYQIESLRTGSALELAVQGEPVGGARGGRGGRGAAPAGGVPGRGRGARGAAPGAGLPESAGSGVEDLFFAAAPGAGAIGGRGGGGMLGGTGGVIPPQDVAQVSENWPSGTVDVRMANYMCQAQQKWTLTPLANVGGYPGSPYFKITIAGTARTLAATADGELVTVPDFSGAPEQLWRLDQLHDGTWRIMPRSIPNSQEPLALSAIGASFATLSKYDPKSEKHRWIIKAP